MLSQRDRGAETDRGGDTIQRQRRGFQKALCLGEALGKQPVAKAAPGELAEMAGEAAPAHRGLFRDIVQRVFVVQVALHVFQQARHTSVGGRLGHGLLDELRLAAAAERRHHQSSRDAVGRFTAQHLAHEVQAAVDARGGTRGRHDVALVDIEHVRIHRDARKLPRQLRGPSPMRGSAAAVEQARMRQYVCAQAQADDPLAFGCGLLESTKQGGGRNFIRIAPGRHHDDVRPRQFL